MKQEDIEHLATLSRIQLSDEEKEQLTKDVTAVLDYVSQVNEITAEEKVKKVGPLHNVMREDEPTHEPGEYTEDVLAAAPVRKGQYIEVKKIIGE